MSLLSRFFHNKRPPDGLLEFVDRVYVFDSCLSTEVLPDGIYQMYLHEVVNELHEAFPTSSILAFNFREGQKQSQFAEILCEYDVTVLDYPRQYEGCPVLPLSLLHHFLRVSDNWLSRHNQNDIILMHCERGGWPLLAFVLASFLIFSKLHSGERRTLEMVHREAPKGFLRLLSPFNPFPSQLRYLQYVARRNISPEWPPNERTLSLDCLILRGVPGYDNHKGCRPMVRIFGRNLRSRGGLSTQMLFSMSKKKSLRHYEQADCDVIKVDIQCLVQGDVVLECLHLDLDPEREVMMFRIMFNTAFIRSNILMLNSENLDILWDSKDRYPKGFRAEVLFAEFENMSPIKAPATVLDGEERVGLPIEAFSRVQELFSGVDWVDNGDDAALWLLKQLTVLQNRVSSQTSPTDSEEEYSTSSIADISDYTEPGFHGLSFFDDPSSQDSPSDDQSDVLVYPSGELMKPSSDHLDSCKEADVLQELTHVVPLSEQHLPVTVAHKVNSPPPSVPPSSDLTGSQAATAKPQASPPPPPPSPPPPSPPPSFSVVELDGVAEASSTISSIPLADAANSVKAKTTCSLPPTPSPPPLPPPPPPPPFSQLSTGHSQPSTHPPPPPPPPPPPTSTSSTQTLRQNIPPPPPPPPLTGMVSKLTPPPPAPPPPPSLLNINPNSHPPPPPPPPPLPAKATAPAPPPPPPPPPPLNVGKAAMQTPPPSSLNMGSNSRAPPPPPPPPPPKATAHNKIGSTPPCPPPPPPLPAKASRTSAPAPPPPPPPPLKVGKAAMQTPPPPPPPPQLSAKVDGNVAVPPPPPPLPPGKGNAPSPPPPPPPPLPQSASAQKGPIPPPPPAPKPLVAPPPPPTKGVPPPPAGVKGTNAPPPPPMSAGRVKASLSSGGRGRMVGSAATAIKKASLKPLHWVKVTRAVQGSLWADAQKQEIQSGAPEIDITELESLFSANSDASGGGRPGNRRVSTINKPEKVQLIELRRANNCEIMLTKIKMPLPEMMNAVLALDSSVLDIDQVENLIKFCPTKEEMEKLKTYTGDKSTLGKCEQFFMELMKVPRVESKLRVFAFKIQFSTQVNDLKNNLQIINSASQEVRESLKLKQIMQTILTLGNALNQGTARGSAVGFKLDSLLKLSDTRAKNNKMTLMHYLCKLLAEKMPELLDFEKDLVHLDQASKIQLKNLAEEMQAVSRGLEKVEHELAASENDGAISIGFRKVLKNFLDTAEAGVRTLTSLYSEVGRNADSLCQYFGEDPARCPFEQVTQILVVFVKLFNKSRDENAQLVEAERKRLEKEALKEKNSAMKKEAAAANMNDKLKLGIKNSKVQP